MVVRSGSVETERIQRADWIDRLDGNGPSRITLDPAGRQLACLSFAGSGATDGRLGLLIDTRWIPLVKFGNGNTARTGLQTPNLPFRWEITSTGGAGSLDAMGCVVSSEGGIDLIGSGRTAYNTAAHSIASGAFEQIVAIRNKSGQYLRAPIIPQDIDVCSTASAAAQWFLIFNPTVATTPVWTPIDGSYAEFDVTRTTVTPGTGVVVKSGFMTNTNSKSQFALREAMQLGANIAGTVRDELVLAVKNLSANPNTFYGAINWLEPN